MPSCWWRLRRTDWVAKLWLPNLASGLDVLEKTQRWIGVITTKCDSSVYHKVRQLFYLKVWLAFYWGATVHCTRRWRAAVIFLTRLRWMARHYECRVFDVWMSCIWCMNVVYLMLTRPSLCRSCFRRCCVLLCCVLSCYVVLLGVFSLSPPSGSSSRLTRPSLCRSCFRRCCVLLCCVVLFCCVVFCRVVLCCWVCFHFPRRPAPPAGWLDPASVDRASAVVVFCCVVFCRVVLCCWVCFHFPRRPAPPAGWLDPASVDRASAVVVFCCVVFCRVVLCCWVCFHFPRRPAPPAGWLDPASVDRASAVVVFCCVVFCRVVLLGVFSLSPPSRLSSRPTRPSLCRSCFRRCFVVLCCCVMLLCCVVLCCWVYFHFPRRPDPASVNYASAVVVLCFVVLCCWVCCVALLGVLCCCVVLLCCVVGCVFTFPALPPVQPADPTQSLSIVLPPGAVKFEEAPAEPGPGVVAWTPPNMNWNPWTNQSTVIEGAEEYQQPLPTSDDFRRELQNKQQSDESYQALLGQRAELPVAQYRQAVVERIRDNRVVIIRGATGCGKTTQASDSTQIDSA